MKVPSGEVSEVSGQTQLKEALVQTKTSSSKELERQDTNKTKAFELKQDIGTMLYDGKNGSWIKT